MKAAIYVRLSEEDRNKQNELDESESIQNQKSMLINYALDKEWDIYNIYCDEDYSGADRNRPGFNSLIEDAKTKKFNIVLCKSQSRFVRDMEQMEKYLHNDFLEWGIRFISLVDNVDNFDSKNKKSRQINGLINEWYLEDISDNIKAVFKNKHREGKSTRSFMPYGYKKADFDKNKVVVDEEAAAVVKRIFEYYISGLSSNKICDILNNEGILSPFIYKQNNGVKLSIPTKSKFPLWTPQAIIRILHNQMYLGDLIHNTCKKISYKSKKIKPVPREHWTIITNTHEAIIDRETFDKVQSILNKRIKPNRSGEVHLFAKKIICAECGGSMHKMSSSYKDSNYSYFRCRTSDEYPKEKCKSQPKIKFEVLKEIVTNRLHEYFSEIDSNEVAAELNFKGENNEKSSRLKREMNKVDKALDKQKEYLKNLYKDKVNGLLSDDEFSSLKSDFSVEQTRLNQKKTKLNEELDVIEEKCKKKIDRLDIVEKLKNFEELDRRIVDEFVDCIEVAGVSNGSQEVIIHWTI